jgi:hypothetical protein
MLVGKPGVPSLALFGYKVSLAEGGGSTVRPEEVLVGIEVKVADSHPISYRRGMVGTIVGRWGGEEFVAVDVHCAADRHRLFYPYDLEEITSADLRGGTPSEVGQHVV